MTRFAKRKFNFNFSVAPQDTACPLRELQAPIGSKQFTFLCYTVSNPEANVTWLANDEEPRQGISVQNTVSQSAFLDTARKRSCGKVMFLHLSVICSQEGVRGKGGWGHVWQGVCVAEEVHGKGACVQERRPLKRAVRILLECILVPIFFCFMHFWDIWLRWLPTPEKFWIYHLQLNKFQECVLWQTKPDEQPPVKPFRENRIAKLSNFN